MNSKNNGSTVPVQNNFYLQCHCETVLLLLNFPLLFCYVFGWQPREGYTPWWIRWHQGLPWPVCRTQGLLLGLPSWHTPSLTVRCFDSSSLVRGVMMFCCHKFHCSVLNDFYTCFACCVQEVLSVRCPSPRLWVDPCLQHTSSRRCSRLRVPRFSSRDLPWNSSGSTSIIITPSPRTSTTGECIHVYCVLSDIQFCGW